MFGSSLPPVVCRGPHVSYLCLLAHRGVQNIFAFFSSSSRVPYVVSFYGFSIFDSPLFFNVYFALIVHIISIQRCEKYFANAVWYKNVHST
jgi:hypothetical protein